MSQNRKYTVFISSTYEDLKAVRQRLVWACLESGHIPLGMESFPASSVGAWEVIQKAIESADYYAVIVANRYGSAVAGGDGISYTEREFDYAAQLGKPILGFVLDPEAEWKSSLGEDDEGKRERLRRFRDKVQTRVVKFWRNADDLHGNFAIAINAAINTSPQEGWVRASEAASAKVTEELARLSAENERLREQLSLVDSEASELSRQDRVIELVKSVPSHILDYHKSLYHLFELCARRLHQDMPLDLVTRQMELRFSGFAEVDFMRLVAFKLLECTTHYPDAPRESVFRLSRFGMDILDRLTREAALAEAARITAMKLQKPATT